MSEEVDFVPLIVDFGSYSCRAGFPGDLPKYDIPSVVGKLRRDVRNAQTAFNPLFGQKALDKHLNLDIKRPLDKGIVRNFDDMEEYMSHLFYAEMKIEPQELPLLFTNPTLNPASDINRMGEILFETFGSPALSMPNQSVLALYSMGVTNGIVLDAGYSHITVTPIVGGMPQEESAKQIDKGGRDISDYLEKELQNRGITLLPSALEEMKREICYVENEICVDLKRREYTEKGSGTTIDLKDEQSSCSEIMFSGPQSIQQVIHQVMLSQQNTNSHKYVYLCGGTSKLPGFQERVSCELEKLSEGGNVTVSTIPNRHASWVGGSKLVSHPDSMEMWIAREDWEENGPDVLQNFWLPKSQKSAHK